MRLVLLAAVLCAGAKAQLQDVRIALRLGTDHVLIVGGTLTSKDNPTAIYDKSMESLPKDPGYSPLQPIEEIYRVPPAYLARFRVDPETNWHVGDRWRVYTGSGAPVSVVIDSLSFGGYCGGLGGYATALARLEIPGSGNVIAGLRSGEYLAAPATWTGRVSEQPLVSVDSLHESGLANAIEKELLERGRKIVGNAEWKAATPEAREMNREFLGNAELKYDGRLLRWSLPGQKPLVVAESVWSSRGSGKPLFGAEAVVEQAVVEQAVVEQAVAQQRDKVNVLAFDPQLGELMRVGETLGVGGWTRPESGVFLNAWAMGDRRFVLRVTHGYEGFSVELMEIVPGKGLVPTNIHFGAGC